MTESTYEGELVVATPDLTDPNFNHTVVLILEHNEEGALGVILNRPSDILVADALPGWDRLAASPPVVFAGGPVQPEAIVALGMSADGAGGTDQDSWEPIVGRLRAVDLTQDPDDIDEVEQIRLFAGYAGWSPGQLEQEVEDGGWFVVDAADSDAVSGNPDVLWRTVLTRQGGVFTTVADDPSLN